MRVNIFLFLCTVATLSVLGSAGQNELDFYGIVPLHSTRVDVEQQFGTSTDSCNCLYRTGKETITVDYAASPCKGQLYGWNVPKDTVLGFRVSPESPLPVSGVNFKSGQFIQTHSQDETLTTYYTDVLAGIRYVVQDNKIVFIRRLPSSKDNRLRCHGFPPYDGGVAEYTTYDSFTSSDDEQTRARLDNFAVQLSQVPSLKGYIIAYAGRTGKKNQGISMARSASRYLIQKRGITARQVTALDGGFREEAQYDLFLLPRSSRPPAPTPQISSDEIRISGRERH